MSSCYLEVRVGLHRGQAATSRNTSKITVNLQALVLGRRNWILCSEETMHQFATSCGFVLTGPACLGRSVSATGEGSTGIGYGAFRIIPDHVRLGKKKYAMDSHALNGYPCLNLCVHTSHTCENTSEWLEVGEEGLETCAGLPDRASA